MFASPLAVFLRVLSAEKADAAVEVFAAVKGDTIRDRADVVRDGAALGGRVLEAEVAVVVVGAVVDFLATPQAFSFAMASLRPLSFF
jgi:hypothetical protein